MYQFKRDVETTSISTEYIRCTVTTQPVSAWDNATLHFAVMAPGVLPSSEDDWKPASKVVGEPVVEMLIGPEGETGALAEGTYDVWVRITVTPEKVARAVGQLVISNTI